MIKKTAALALTALMLAACAPQTTKLAGASSGKSVPAKHKTPKNVYKFGDKVRLADGSTLKVGIPEQFSPSKYAAEDGTHKRHVKIKLTFTNNTAKVYDPSLTSGSITSGGREGGSVYQEGLDSPDTKILPGKSITWWMGYGVKNPGKVTFQVNIGFLDYPDLIFTDE